MSELHAASGDFDLRLVRYFVSVAEHRHFGRAAAALHLAQPSLSRQVQRLERQLGARLLDRTPRGAELTTAGAAFLPQAKALLRSSTRAVALTRAAARPAQLTIGYTTGLIITPAVRALRHHHPDARIDTVHLSWDEPRQALLEHRADAVIARLPFPTDQVHVTVLYDEPRLLLVSIDHRLAGKESVTLDDIADEPTPRLHDPEWNAFWRIDPRPDGRRAPDGPLVHTLEDKLEHVASGDAVAITPAGAMATNNRPDLTTVPLDGVQPAHVVLATRTGEHHRLITAFRTAAQTHLTGPTTRTG